jgi:hypothetical protein
MRSVPTERSGVASAVNNAISRVGPQLAGALIFVAISASFYSGLANRLPGVDTSSATFREQVSPLNRPAQEVPPDVKVAAREESGISFELGMLIASGLLVLGAVVNWVGIQNPRGAGAAARAGPAAEPVPEAEPTQAEPGAEPARAPVLRAASDRPPPCQHGPVPVVLRSGASAGDGPPAS